MNEVNYIISIVQDKLQARVKLPKGFVNNLNATVTEQPNSLLVGIGNNLISVGLNLSSDNFDGNGLAESVDSELFDLPDDVLGEEVAVNVHAIYANKDNEELYSNVQTFTDRPATPGSSDITIKALENPNELINYNATSVIIGGANIEVTANYLKNNAVSSVRVFMYVDEKLSESDIFELTVSNTNGVYEKLNKDCEFRRITNAVDGDAMTVVVVCTNAFGKDAHSFPALLTA